MLSAWSCSLGSCNKQRRTDKTSKSKLMHELEKGVTTADSVPIPFVSIIDGVALVRMFNCTGLTCKEFPDDLFKFAVARSCVSKAYRHRV